jgi:hypothetical protein
MVLAAIIPSLTFARSIREPIRDPERERDGPVELAIGRIFLAFGDTRHESEEVLDVGGRHLLQLVRDRLDARDSHVRINLRVIRVLQQEKCRKNAPDERIRVHSSSRDHDADSALPAYWAVQDAVIGPRPRIG